MSRSLDQSRPFRAGRHRAETAPVITAPLTPTGSGPDVPAPPEPASAPLRRRRARGPAFEVPPAPDPAAKAGAASPATEAIAAVAPSRSAAESAAATEATRRSRGPREAAGKPAAKPAAAPTSRPATAHNPQIPSVFTSDAQAVLKRAASLRAMGHRMAVVAGALAVVLAVGTASQATELPFFGNESFPQDAPEATDATRARKGTPPTYSSGHAAPRPGGSKPSGAAPAHAVPGTDEVHAGDPDASALAAVSDLPMPVDAPTLAGILAASPATAPPSPAPTVILEPPVMSSAAPAAPTSPAVPATSEPTTPPPSATAPAPAPSASPLPPSPTAAATATAPAAGDAASEETVDTRSYASARLASYGWGPEQMDALNLLWDTSVRWRPSQVNRGLSYIKERYGSPVKAQEFHAANKWY